MAHRTRRHLHDHYQTFTLLQCGGHALLQALGILCIDHKFVDHHLDVVVLVTLEHHSARHLAHLAINAHVQIALTHHLLKQFLVVSLAVPHKRGKHIYALAVIVIEDEIENLLLGILHHLLAREVRISIGRTRKEQTQVVIYLGSCSYRRAGVLVGSLLLDRYDRAKTCYLVHIGTLQSAKEITRIGRECLKVTALPLGKDRVECQG